MNALISWFIPPELERDPRNERAARLTVLISLFTVGLAVQYAGFFSYIGYGSGARIVVQAGVTTLAVPFVLRWTRSLWFAAQLCVLSMFVVITRLTFLAGGSHAVTMGWQAVAPAFAMLLLGRRAGFFWTFAACVAIGSTFWLEAHGSTFANEIPAENMTLYLVASDLGLPVTIMMAVLLFSGTVDRAMLGLEASRSELEAEKQRVEERVEAAVAASEAARTDLAASVRQMLEAMNRFSQGDLTVSLPSARSDEVGQLFQGFNRAAGKMSSMLQQVRASSDATAQASGEIASATQHFARSAQEQSGKAAAAAAEVTQMTEQVQGHAARATQTAAAARANGQSAAEGSRVVEQTIAKMAEIAEIVAGSSRSAGQLATASREIGDIVKLIADVARATRILSLNASVEAARAGDHGRGFAVVASEVGKLADSTASATIEITRRVKAMQEETVRTAEAMRRGDEELAETIGLADRAREMLRTIVDGTRSTVGLIEQLAAASHEQARASGQLVESVRVISSVTEASSRGLDEVAGSAQRLNQLTSDLDQLVAQFKLEAGRAGLVRSARRTGPAELAAR